MKKSKKKKIIVENSKDSSGELLVTVNKIEQTENYPIKRGNKNGRSLNSVQQH